MSYFPVIAPQPIQQPIAQLPWVLDAPWNHTFSQTIKSSAQIENGKLLVRDKRATNQFDPQYFAFMHFLSWVHNNRVLFSQFQLNPYWKALIEIVGYFQYRDIQFVFANADIIHGQIKTKFLSQRTALEYATFIEPIAEQIKVQKAVFKRCLDKHKQINCLFLDLPCIFTKPLQLDDEVKLPKIARKWLERLHQSEELAEKLYDVQWRIVKSLNGVYAIHAMIYIIGDEAQYSDFILQKWRGACLSKGYELMQGVPYNVLEKNCYISDSDMRNFWRLQIEFFNEPFKIYRYVSEHISYLWQTYTGNIPVKSK